MTTRRRRCLISIPIVLAMIVGPIRTASARFAEPLALHERPLDGRIAFASDRDGDYEIFVISRHSSVLTQLTHNEVDDRSPAWSAGGRRIVFVRDMGHHKSDLVVMSSDGSAQSRLRLSTGQVEDPTWSPNGEWIAFRVGGIAARGAGVYLTTPTGSRRTPIVPFERHALNRDPSWSPDGKRIAFVRSQKGSTIWSVQNCCNGRFRTPVTTEPSDDYSPDTYMADLDWSPGGGVIGFTEDGQAYSPLGERFRAVLVDYETGATRTIPTEDLWSTRFGAWSPSGERILLFARKMWDSAHDLFVISPDGTGLHRLTTDPASDIEPDWFLRDADYEFGDSAA